MGVACCRRTRATATPRRARCAHTRRKATRQSLRVSGCLRLWVFGCRSRTVRLSARVSEGLCLSVARTLRASPRQPCACTTLSVEVWSLCPRNRALHLNAHRNTPGGHTRHNPHTLSTRSALLISPINTIHMNLAYRLVIYSLTADNPHFDVATYFWLFRVNRIPTEYLFHIHYIFSSRRNS